MAQDSDRPQVEALVEAAYSPWVALIRATPGPMLDDYETSIARGQVQVVDGPDGIEAILVLIDLPDALLLDNIAVAPWAQGRGFAKPLMRMAEATARDRGYSRIRLYTHEKMASNVALYTHLGYAITHRVTERGLNRVYMEKPLADPDG